jgi:predicted nuclease of predicted toxin-antitoxin system
MLRLLFDENFNRPVVDGVRRVLPAADLLTVQEAGLSGMKDPPLLEWAATENRILVTSDVRTMIEFAAARLRAGKPCPGVIIVTQQVPVGLAVEDLITMVACSDASEWENQITHLPLK